MHDLHLNSLAQHFANNREQWSEDEMIDRPPDSDKYAEHPDFLPTRGPARLGKKLVYGGESSSKRGTDEITHSRVNLREMYGRTVAERGESPSVRGQIAERLVEQMGCPGEVARDLATLTLYDVAILISRFRCWCSFLRACFSYGWMDG